MLDITATEQLIAHGLSGGHIGTPVAVHLVAHQSPEALGAESLNSWALDRAARWLGAVPRRTEDTSTPNHTVRLVSFDRGQTALLSTGKATTAAELLQITVLGNHGILDWNGTPRLQQAPQSSADTTASRTRRPIEPPYGVLLVAGDHTHQPMYAAAFQADKRCRLIGLTDEVAIAPERRRLNQQLADRLAIPLLDDFDQAIARHDVQIVSICAEPVRRGPLIVRAAHAGKHLYLDKPLAGSLDELDRVVAAVRDAGVLAHMFSSLTAAPLARVRQVLRSGRLGALQALHFELCFAKGHAGSAELGTPRREMYPPHRYELADAKRELTNVGVYPLTLLAALCEQRPVRVAATTGNYFFAEHQLHNMEDFGQILLELDGGAVASCSAGRTGWQSHPADGLNRVTLVGSDDVAVIEAHWPRVELWSDAQTWLPPARNPLDPMAMWVTPTDSPYIAQPKRRWLTPPALSPADDVAYFLDCLQSGSESQADAATAALASEILLAAYRSAAEEAGVKLPLQR